jgi:hypothetical protein
LLASSSDGSSPGNRYAKSQKSTETKEQEAERVGFGKWMQAIFSREVASGRNRKAERDLATLKRIDGPVFW